MLILIKMEKHLNKGASATDTDKKPDQKRVSTTQNRPCVHITACQKLGILNADGWPVEKIPGIGMGVIDTSEQVANILNDPIYRDPVLTNTLAQNAHFSHTSEKEKI